MPNVVGTYGDLEENPVETVFIIAVSLARHIIYMEGLYNNVIVVVVLLCSWNDVDGDICIFIGAADRAGFPAHRLHIYYYSTRFNSF